jgi:hemerythrin-like metal-binding protein
MALFEWNENLSVKVIEMDEQHKKLIGLINALNDAMANRKGAEALKKTLDEMTNYTVEHFGNEEKYMTAFNFPGTFMQKQEHKKFIDKTRELQKGLAEGKLMLSMETMNFLKDWLQKHIMGMDKHYSKYFNDNGMK